jgi:tRNA (guanine37-N1)-methyltransferase
MNLPASALEFLHSFRGLYHGREELFAPRTSTQLPMVHAHCFAVKGDFATASREILQRIEKEIGLLLRVGNGETEGEVTITEVRDVAPNKTMFCAGFRLPAVVAFAPRA